MDEQFILRVPPSVAERIDCLLSENASSSEDKSLDVVFSDGGRTGTFVIGSDRFPASLFDLPCVVESCKTYDDSALVKTADVGQRVRRSFSRHGLTPPIRDARKQRFRREPGLNVSPELVQHVEKDLVNIMSGGTVENLDAEANGQSEAGDENARNANKKAPPAPAAKPEVAGTGAADGTDSDDSDDSI